jgi:hypothetical protein
MKLPFPDQAKTILIQIVTNHILAIQMDLEPLYPLQKGLVGKNFFREDLVPFRRSNPISKINLFPTTSFWYPLYYLFFASFTKMEDTMKQQDLLPLTVLPQPIPYDLLFQPFSNSSLAQKGRGRPPFDRVFLLKAFIYKALRGIDTLTDLAFEFCNNPSIYQTLGFDLYKAPPSIERFSQFLRDTPNQFFQNIRIHLVQTLLLEKVITGKHLVMDSCPILANVRENNLKTAVANRFDKTRIPKGDPDARLGIQIHFPQPFKKEIRYFWGYRNHIVGDAPEEIPVWEVTHPADVSEIPQAIPMLRDTKETFSLTIEIVGGDAVYDSEDILCFIIKDLKAQAVIPRNPRGESTTPSYTLKGKDVYCQADLPMYRKGKSTHSRTGITYLAYCCPIHYGKERQHYLLCPAAHPKFITQKGCYVTIRLTPSIREQIDYGTETFKQLHNKRTAIERIFSRLLSIAMQDPPVIGKLAIQNYCTIAHITVLLVALAAKRSGHDDKIRFVKSFIPTFSREASKRIS